MRPRRLGRTQRDSTSDPHPNPLPRAGEGAASRRCARAALRAYQVGSGTLRQSLPQAGEGAQSPFCAKGSHVRALLPRPACGAWGGVRSGDERRSMASLLASEQQRPRSSGRRRLGPGDCVFPADRDRLRRAARPSPAAGLRQIEVCRHPPAEIAVERCVAVDHTGAPTVPKVLIASPVTRQMRHSGITVAPMPS